MLCSNRWMSHLAKSTYLANWLYTSNWSLLFSKDMNYWLTVDLYLCDRHTSMLFFVGTWLPWPEKKLKHYSQESKLYVGYVCIFYPLVSNPQNTFSFELLCTIELMQELVTLKLLAKRVQHLNTANFQVDFQTSTSGRSSTSASFLFQLNERCFKRKKSWNNCGLY